MQKEIGLVVVKKGKKALTLGLALGVMSAMTASVAYAQDPVPVIDLTVAASDLLFLAKDAIGKAIPVGIVILGAIMGWKFFKRFVRG